MTNEFMQFNLRPELVQAVTELGYTTPTPIQIEMIPVMITGCDVIGQAQTGTGKTAAFALPILHRLVNGQGRVQSLILTPTRELATQVSEAIAEYGKFMGVRTLAVYGGQAYGPQINKLNRGVDIVVGTPGRLIDLINKKVLDISHVHTVVLDEADEMLSMGFVEDIETILSSTPAERQTALFSATMPTEIRRLAGKYMHQPHEITIKREQVTVDNTEQRYYMVYHKDKLAALTRLFEMDDFTSVLIFVRTRATSSEIANQLTARGYPAEALNGDLNQEARERTLERFRQNRVKVLVATDVAARGLDIDNISHVINFDLPENAEPYVHRIGRTGRAGKSGVALSLVSPSDRQHLQQIERFTRKKLIKSELPSEEDLIKYREANLLKQVSTWLGRGRCRRERAMVDQLVEEGFEPLDIAAAALKIARAEEKQRPIEPVAQVMDREKVQRTGRKFQDRPMMNQNFSRNSTSHEAGMVRLTMDVGKNHGLRPSDIVGAIAAQASIPGSVIGKIRIQDNNTQVDVPEEYLTRLLEKSRPVVIRKQRISLQVAS